MLYPGEVKNIAALVMYLCTLTCLIIVPCCQVCEGLGGLPSGKGGGGAEAAQAAEAAAHLLAALGRWRLPEAVISREAGDCLLGTIYEGADGETCDFHGGVE